MLQEIEEGVRRDKSHWAAWKVTGVEEEKKKKKEEGEKKEKMVIWRPTVPPMETMGKNLLAAPEVDKTKFV